MLYPRQTPAFKGGWWFYVLIYGLFTVGCADRTRTIDIPEGRYLELAPDTADPDRPIPLLVYFHSYQNSAESYSRRSWLTQTANERGYLLILPDGLQQSWSAVGAPSARRDEIAFLRAVLDSVNERWSISEDKVVGGFSAGAFLTWDVACYMGDAFSAFIPSAGTFWDPVPKSCPYPAPIRHTHGTADKTVPLEGRSIGSARQGNVYEAFGTMRSTNGCDDQSEEIVVGETSCSVWSNCTTDKELQLCLHQGGHTNPSGYLDDSLDWAEGMTPL